MENTNTPATTAIHVEGREYLMTDLPGLLGERLWRLPVVLRHLLENVLRKCDDEAAILRTKAARIDWLKTGTSEEEIEFYPTRVLMHDTTCGPALADIAAMRSVLEEEGCDPAILNPVLRPKPSWKTNVADET